MYVYVLLSRSKQQGQGHDQHNLSQFKTFRIFRSQFQF